VQGWRRRASQVAKADEDSWAQTTTFLKAIYAGK
jgi:hypothetical protein